MTATSPEDPAQVRLVAQPSVMERLWEGMDRWIAIALLIPSVVASVFTVSTLDEFLAGLGLAVIAAAWAVLGHSLAPPARRQRPVYALVFLLGLLALAAALMSVTPAYFVFAVAGFFHAAALRPYALVFVGTGATGLLILYITWGEIPREPDELVIFVAILAIQTVLIGVGVTGSERMAELSEQRRRTAAELRTTLAENERLHARLVEQARSAGVTDERQRLAREIHDTVAQGLTGVITQLEAAEQADGDAVARRRHLDHAAAIARESLSEARRSVYALAPGALERGRLPDALDELARDWSQRQDLEVVPVVTGEVVTLPADLEVALLRVAQEALNNVAKHAQAARVGVTLSLLDDRAVLDVRDDGIGFDPRRSPRGASFGLTAMRQRLAELGGALEIESAPGAGTAVSATVPIPAEPRAAAPVSPPEVADV